MLAQRTCSSMAQENKSPLVSSSQNAILITTLSILTHPNEGHNKPRHKVAHMGKHASSFTGGGNDEWPSIPSWNTTLLEFLLSSDLSLVFSPFKKLFFPLGAKGELLNQTFASYKLPICKKCAINGASRISFDPHYGRNRLSPSNNHDRFMATTEPSDSIIHTSRSEPLLVRV